MCRKSPGALAGAARRGLVCQPQRVSGVGIYFFYLSTTHPLALLSVPCTGFAKYGGAGGGRRCVRLRERPGIATKARGHRAARRNSALSGAPFVSCNVSICVMEEWRFRGNFGPRSLASRAPCPRRHPAKYRPGPCDHPRSSPWPGQ
ncbi:hypothetical protein E2C01_078439 [Portunus trituberculatus]|uniref:Uncharacterized protein n=1 Tax=Portunus trituberculatus TaxID=210409 RepID=A0A5B7IML0_PORTR|nr:hypothetical protein [Portunus trituberculatus]